jgi:pentatricopeptide repeat protein
VCETNPPTSPSVSHILGSNQARHSGVIHQDFRASPMIDEDDTHARRSSWDQAFRRCSSPLQIRSIVARVFSHEADIRQEDILSIFHACQRIALIGTKEILGSAECNQQNPLGLKSNKTPSDITMFQTHHRQCFEIAHGVMLELNKRLILPSLNVYSAYINTCAYTGQVDAAFLALDDLKRVGIVPNLSIFKGLIMAAARHGDLSRALEVVEVSIKSTHSISQHTKWLKMGLRIAVGIEIGKWAGIYLSLATGMNEIATQVVGIGFGSVFGLRLAVPILIPNGISPAISKKSNEEDISKTFLNAKFQPSEGSHSVLRSSDERATQEIMLSFLVSELEKSGNVEGAITVLREMGSKNIPITVQIAENLVAHLVRIQRSELALEILQNIHFPSPTCRTFYPLLQSYYDLKEFQKCIYVFEEFMTQKLVSLDAPTHTLLISSYGKINQLEKAESLYQQFLREGHVPSSFMLNTMISILSKNGRFRQAEDVLLVVMPQHKVKPTAMSYTKLIDKARVIENDSYQPPVEEQVYPPLHCLFLSKNSSIELPIQLRRAWFWFSRWKASSDVTSPYPLMMMMNVLNSYGYSKEALTLYRREHSSIEGIIPLCNDLVPTGEGTRGLYQVLLSVLCQTTDVGPAASIALLYEMKARGIWPHYLPSPMAIPELENIVLLVSQKKYCSPSTDFRNNHDTTRTDNSILESIMTKVLNASPNTAHLMELKCLLLDICDFYLKDANRKKVGTEDYLERAVQPSSKTVNIILPSSASTASCSELSNYEEEDDDNLFQSSLVPFTKLKLERSRGEHVMTEADKNFPPKRVYLSVQYHKLQSEVLMKKKRQTTSRSILFKKSANKHLGNRPKSDNLKCDARDGNDNFPRGGTQSFWSSLQVKI